MNKKVTAYYGILLAVLAMQVVATVVQGSLVVSHGKKVAQIEAQMQELRQEKNQLASAIARESSLVSVKDSAELENYVAISSPLVVTTNSTVAYTGL